MLGAGRRALLVAVCCLFIDGVSSAKRRGLQQETIDRANAALLRENTHREALLPEQVVGESFTIEYKGVRGDERTVELVDVDTIEIPPIEMGAAEGGQNLIFCPGYPVYGNITIRAVKGSDIAKINQEWWANTLKAGPDATKSDIVVTLMTKDVSCFSLLHSQLETLLCCGVAATPATCDAVLFGHHECCRTGRERKAVFDSGETCRGSRQGNGRSMKLGP